MDLGVLCGLLVTFAAVGVAVVWVFRSFELIEEGTVGVVERDGRFQRIWLPGRHLLLPFDRIRQVVKLQDFTHELKADKVQTKTTVIGISMTVRYHIARAAPRRGGTRNQLAELPRRPIIRLSGELAVDAESVYRAVYTVDKWQEQTEEEAKSILYQFFGGLMIKEQIIEPEGALSNLSKQLAYLINARTMRFGVQISSVNLFNLVLEPATMQTLNAERRFQRESHLRELEAKHQREIAKVLELNTDQLLHERERMQYLETLKEIAKNPHTRFVIAPTLRDAGASAAMEGGGNAGSLPYNERLPLQEGAPTIEDDDMDDEFMDDNV